jgi:hypothetical protein
MIIILHFRLLVGLMLIMCKIKEEGTAAKTLACGSPQKIGVAFL